MESTDDMVEAYCASRYLQWTAPEPGREIKWTVFPEEQRSVFRKWARRDLSAALAVMPSE